MRSRCLLIPLAAVLLAASLPAQQQDEIYLEITQPGLRRVAVAAPPLMVLPGTPADSETGSADDPDDHYREGWVTRGFWSYGTKGTAPGEENWGYYTGVLEPLSNGEWVGYVFDENFSYTLVPGEPAAAPLPEPANVAMLALGAASLMNTRRRRN